MIALSTPRLQALAHDQLPDAPSFDLDTRTLSGKPAGSYFPGTFKCVDGTWAYRSRKVASRVSHGFV